MADSWGGEAGRAVIPGASVITPAILMAAGADQGRVATYRDSISSACHEFEIDLSQLRVAHFLAQVGHESNGFRYTAEVWGPTSYQLTYENRHELGNDLPGAGGPGNGRRWAGHGFIEVTGYYNHVAMANYFSVPIDQIVSWLQTPAGASRSAGLFWYQHGCNVLADNDDAVGVTRKINPGLLNLADRQYRLSLIKKAQEA